MPTLRAQAWRFSAPLFNSHVSYMYMPPFTAITWPVM